MSAILRKNQGLLYVLPALLFVALFVLWPLAQLVYLSLTDTSLLGGGKFIGFENYVRAFEDRAFWRALEFTGRYTLFITPLLMGLGFALALLTAPNRALQQVTRGIIFLPVVIGLGSSSLLWFWLFDQQVGMFNRILVDIGILSEPMVWFTRADPALFAVIISVTWKVIGFGMLLFVAGIQSINGEIGEAALIDGGNYWQRVWYILLPLSLRVILLTTQCRPVAVAHHDPDRGLRRRHRRRHRGSPRRHAADRIAVRSSRTRGGGILRCRRHPTKAQEGASCPPY